MADVAMLVQARQELEELYSGVPDESVNLTFRDFVQLQQQNGVAERKNNHNMMETVHEEAKNMKDLGKSPSLDFAKALKAAKDPRNNQGEDHMHTSREHHQLRYTEGNMFRNYRNPNSPNRNKNPTAEVKVALESSFCDDISGISISSSRNPYQKERRGRRRPGIPHSKICTICSTYIYIFRNRCLVCGRVYCRQCRHVGMGEMTEGRKCVECLGRRFSQRYIDRAGATGCCAGYPSMVKQQELKWAEKGPRGMNIGGERDGRPSSRSIIMMSTTHSTKTTTRRSTSPVTPTSRRLSTTITSGPHSFVMASSPFSINHPSPF